MDFDFEGKLSQHVPNGGKIRSQYGLWEAKNGVRDGSLGCLGEGGCPSRLLGHCSSDLWLIGSLLWRLWAVFEGQLGTLVTSHQISNAIM